MNSNNNVGNYLHHEHPKTCAVDDFWGQVSRTVKGVPVDQKQIDMIVEAIQKGLDLSSDDVLLDLGCGNGALSKYFFNHCVAFRGIDFSEYSIQIAKKNFEIKNSHIFTEDDAVHFVKTDTEPERYTKVLCYGAFSYFSEDVARRLLVTINQLYINVRRVYIGNLPDKDLYSLFFTSDKPCNPDLDDPNSAIGIWRSINEFSWLASETGWQVEFIRMPEEFYSSHYRYDVLLRRKN